jgi:transposase
MGATPSLPQLLIKRLDHHGLVAGMCKELSLARMIDAILPKQAEYNVSHGQALVAMILNGLGFHSRTLHMFPEFFADKPTERLIGKDVLPEHLNDDVMGRCLDALFEAGVSELYQLIAEKVVEKLKLKSKAVHLDITSFHVDGAYEIEDMDGVERIKLVRGYSRDHRPELNQVVLKLMCENQAGLPVYMQAMSGNTNDQKAFAEVTRHHLQSLKAAQQSRYFVGDAALYTRESLKAMHEQGQRFASRVPMTLKEAKQQVAALEAKQLRYLGNGYSAYWVTSNYAGVEQRWLLVQSRQAAKREQQTLEKNLLKDTTKELKQFAKLCKKRFACQQDAEQALEEFRNTLKRVCIEDTHVIKTPVYRSKGRPKKGEKPSHYDYLLTGQVATDLEKVAEAKAQVGVFILATNDLTEELTMQELLDIYKSQQSVERGFRFLKSPEFLTSSLFLKKPERIEALLMVMTCSLMIYAALEHRIRNALKEQERYFPDMKNKLGQNPTARWVFLCFSGIHEVSMGGAPPRVTDITERQEVIIEVLGERYEKIYS